MNILLFQYAVSLHDIGDHDSIVTAEAIKLGMVDHVWREMVSISTCRMNEKYWTRKNLGELDSAHILVYEFRLSRRCIYIKTICKPQTKNGK